MLKVNGRRFCTTDLTNVDGGGGLEAVQVGFPNSRYVQPGENLAAAYSWLKSTARDGSMGTLSAANPRYLVLLPGVHDISAVAATAANDGLARYAYDQFFDTPHVHLIPACPDEADATIVQLATTLINVASGTQQFPISLERCCYGVFLRMGTHPAVPTFGLSPRQAVVSSASGGTPMARNLPFEKILTLSDNWSVSGGSATLETDTDSTSEPQGQKATAVSGTSSIQLYKAFTAIDLSDTQWSFRFRIHDDQADTIPYIELWLKDSNGSARWWKGTVWSKRSNTYYRNAGWHYTTWHLDNWTSITDGFDITQVVQVWVIVKKDQSTDTPAVTIDRIEAYRVRSEAFMPFNGASGRKLRVTGGTGVTPGWFTVGQKLDGCGLTMTDAIHTANVDDVVGDCIGIANAQTGVAWSVSGKTLTKAGAFSGYTWQPGDCVHVTGGTGVTTGWYVIDLTVVPTADAVKLVRTLKSSDASDVTIDAVGQPIRLTSGSYRSQSKVLTVPGVRQPQTALYTIGFDDAFASAEPAVRYCLSKGITPVLYVYGIEIDHGTGGGYTRSTLATLQRLARAGAVIANHSYAHNSTRFYDQSVGSPTEASTEMLADVRRQQWWMNRNGFGGPGTRIFAVPGGKFIGGKLYDHDPQWEGITDYVRYTMHPCGSVYVATALDAPHGWICTGDNVGEANTALSVAIKNTSLCHLLFHKFAPDTGGVSLTDFKSHIDAVAECVRAGAVRVVTPFDLLRGN